MFILTRKLLLFVFFIYLINTTTVAQPVFNSFDCIESVNFTRNGPYERNLDANLAALPTTDSGFGFFNLSIGQGTDRANSFALCRGDVEPDVCRICLNDSIAKLRQMCPNENEAIGYYNYCMLKYSNETLLRNTGIRFYEYSVNNETVSDRVGFERAARPLLNRLRKDAAAGGSVLKFATGNTSGPDFETIYGLVQCCPDLLEQECSDCLEDAIDQFFLDKYRGNIGGRTLVPKCNFRYEINRFYNRSTTSQPSPPPGMHSGVEPTNDYHERTNTHASPAVSGIQGQPNNPLLDLEPNHNL